MPRPIPLSLLAAVLACAPTPGVPAAPATAPVRSGATARVALTQPLPAMDGAHLEVTVVEVRYGPGESSSPHRHPCAVTGYVVEGAFRSQSGTEPERVYQAGESFYEAPNAVHRVSANASAEVPVKFVAHFVCDRKAPLTTPEAGEHAR
jgi:quercetin dioxygenase-like cupin family protein